MSENNVTLIPVDPRFVPTESAIQLVTARLREIAPHSDEVEVLVSQEMRFIDCGANLASIRCPVCSESLSEEWWGARMDDDFQGDTFLLEQYALPCCGTMQTLNHLEYNWPQGFAKYSVCALNPGIQEIPEAEIRTLETIVGCRLRTIWQHL